MAGGFQKFQNAGQTGSFSNIEVGNGLPSVLALLLAFVLLIALLSTEKRYRKLRERLAAYQDERLKG